MAEVWIYTLVSVFVVSLISLIGILTISLNMERLRKAVLFLVSFAAGSLLGGAFFHLIPESFEKTSNTVIVSFSIVLGIIFFLALEKFLYWYHCHIPTSDNHPHPMAINNIIGDGFHNFIDGIIIAASFMVSIPLGIATTVAVILHEIPQEIGDFGILIHAGYSKRKALFFNYLSSSLALIGAVLAIILGNQIERATEILIPLTAGGFIYIAAADLIPDLKKEEDLKKSLLQLFSFVAGIAVMALLLLIDT